MKKIIPILFILSAILSGIHITVATHYCRGSVTASEVSFSGKMASCGMEDVQNECPVQPFIGNNCCEDQVTFYRISSNYIPEYFRVSLTTGFPDMPFAPECDVLLRGSHIDVYRTLELPPGEKLKSAPSLSEICVYRI